MKKLTNLQRNFVLSVVEGVNHVDAYRNNYDVSRLDEKRVRYYANALLNKPQVAAEIFRLQKELARSTLKTAADVTNEFLRVAYADPGQVMHHRRLCCRYCYGINHAYQWKNEREFKIALALHAQPKTGRRKSPIPEAAPTDEGGYGFRFNMSPHPDCPECLGEGHVDLFIADTTKMSADDRRMIKKMKVTKDGLSIELRDQSDALTKAGQMLGGFKTTVVLENPDGSNVAPGAPVIVNMTPDEATAAYKKWMDGQK
jgi:phage terminase small subunit